MATTQTNGVAQPTPSLDNMLVAMVAARAVQPLPREYRMHPDDYAELKRSESLKVRTPLEWKTFGGLDIVLDPQAPRLPRKSSMG
jgi:hypothetical protein